MNLEETGREIVSVMQGTLTSKRRTIRKMKEMERDKEKIVRTRRDKTRIKYNFEGRVLSDADDENM